MPELIEWVKQNVSGTPGTGTVTLDTAVDAAHIRIQDDSRIIDGSKVFYTVQDGNNKERGIGTYTATGTTLSRDTIHAKLENGTLTENPGTGLNLSSSAVVSVTAIADAMGIVVGSAYTDTSAKITCSTAMSRDNTIPQITEGAEVLSLAYTPKFADSDLLIEFAGWGGIAATGRTSMVALFHDAVADADAVAANLSDYYPGLNLCKKIPASSTTSRTYRIRVGSTDGTTIYINGDHNGGDIFAGASVTSLRVTEIRG